MATNIGLKPKVLYSATSDIHINTFHLPYLKLLKMLGYEVHLAFENRAGIKFEDADYCHEIPFKRSPLSFNHFATFTAIYRLINVGGFDLIHCHTPAVSVLTRLASVTSRRKGTKVIYTAHGFHFFKGGSIRNWLFYFPIEWVLSFFTDVIVLINREDYCITKRWFGNRVTTQIKGIGVNSKKFKTINSEKCKILRAEYGYEEDEFILIYVAEFIPRKNHEFLIKSMPRIAMEVPKVKLILVGRGTKLESMKALAGDLAMGKYINFLGWRDDTNILSNIADICISSSKQEGLGLGIAEAMLCSKPVVASNDRGHREMVNHGVNGFLYEHNNRTQLITYVKELALDKEKRVKMAEAAKIKGQDFLISNSLFEMERIYSGEGN